MGGHSFLPRNYQLEEFVIGGLVTVMDSEGNPTQIPAGSLTLPGIGGMAIGSVHPSLGTSGNTPNRPYCWLYSVSFFLSQVLSLSQWFCGIPNFRNKYKCIWFNNALNQYANVDSKWQGLILSWLFNFILLLQIKLGNTVFTNIKNKAKRTHHCPILQVLKNVDT